ncbi:MAG: hypothetical protein ACI3XM_08990 [Eubacteriales bacterium]
MKKQLVLCSALLFAASFLLASCQNQPNGATRTQETASDTASITTEAKDSHSDTVPDLDFGGAAFRTIQQNPGKYGFYTDAENGDMVNDVLYKRIRNAEERLNIDVTETECMVYSDVADHLIQAVLSGSDDYDLVLNQIFRSGSVAIENYLYDWNEIPYIQLSQPWYTKSIQDASLGNSLYMIESDLSISYMNQTWFILYNKTITDSQDIPDLYQVVNEGKWTIDYLYMLASGLYQDMNGNSKADDGDRFGLATSVSDDCMTAAVVYAANGRLVEVNEDGTAVTHVIEEEKNLNTLAKVSSLLYELPNVYNKLGIGSSERIPRFVSGDFVFVTSQVGSLINDELRSCNDHYGVLPLPKYDESQAEYYTLVDGGADILTVPITVGNPELVGAAVEIMSAFSYDEVVPTYMNIGLEQKGTRDEESIRMLRQILDSRVIDFGYLYDTGRGWVMKLNQILKKPDAIASSVEKQKKSVDKYYTGIIETFHADNG